MDVRGQNLSYGFLIDMRTHKTFLGKNQSYNDTNASREKEISKSTLKENL